MNIGTNKKIEINMLRLNKNVKFFLYSFIHQCQSCRNMNSISTSQHTAYDFHYQLLPPTLQKAAPDEDLYISLKFTNKIKADFRMIKYLLFSFRVDN